MAHSEAILTGLCDFKRFGTFCAVLATQSQICTDNALAGLCGAVVSLFGGEFIVAFAAHGLQITRMVDLDLRPAA